MSASLRFLLISVVAVAAFGSIALLRADPAAMSQPSASVDLPGSSGGFEPLPAASAASADMLVARSPFAQDRSAYSRAQPAPPPEREIEVRLVGVFTVGGQLRATLLVDGRETEVGVGEETPAGPVTAIEADAVVIGASPARRIGLFE